MRRQSNSKLKSIERKADRAFQDYFRETEPNGKCEICGKRFNIVHHFIEKHSSLGLRFERKNAVKLCNQCHASHHLGGNTQIHATILRNKGFEWYDELIRLKNERKSWHKTVAFYEERIEEIKQWKANQKQ